MAKGDGAGPPKGNTNAAYPGMWRDALRRACAKDRTAMDDIAKALITAAKSGDVFAIKEFGDRMDGRSTAHVQITNASKEETFAEAVRHVTEKAAKNAKPANKPH